MDEILEILSNDARVTAEEIAKMTGKSKETVQKAIRAFEKEGIIVKYKTIINPEMLNTGKSRVRALIEVSVSPQKNVGFDNIAERMYSFPEVTSCFLVSGAYDLLLVVEGEDIQAVSHFIAAKLSSMEHVRATSTHFLLKKYKEDGQVLKKSKNRRRLNISY